MKPPHPETKPADFRVNKSEGLRGRYKGKGLLKALAAEKERELADNNHMDTLTKKPA